MQGGGDMGAIPNKLPGFQDIVDDDEARARFDAAYGVAVPPRYGMHLSAMFDAMDRGELRALYVMGENPAQSEADVLHAPAPARVARPARRARPLPHADRASSPTSCSPRPRRGVRPRAP